VQGLNELEAYLPAKLTTAIISTPKQPSKLNYQQRKDMAVQSNLKAINDLLDTAKSTKGRGVGDCWPAPLKDTFNNAKTKERRSAARNTGEEMVG
jgi:hypothetical protein